MDVAQTAMEEAGSYCPVGLNDCGNPGCITAWSDVTRLPEVRPEVQNNAAQFLWTFRQVTRVDGRGVFIDERLHLPLETVNLLRGQRYCILTLRRPAALAVRRLELPRRQPGDGLAHLPRRRGNLLDHRRALVGREDVAPLVTADRISRIVHESSVARSISSCATNDSARASDYDSARNAVR